MSVFTLTLKLLTPLHIGDGIELRQGFDFVVHNGYTYRLDEDAILAAKAPNLKKNSDGGYLPLGKQLSKADYKNHALFRYILCGAPSSSKEDARIRSFIKDVHDRPYIPGSSLKGAIRTALAWNALNIKKVLLQRGSFGSKPTPGQPLERHIFGDDPKKDLLRALQISDLHAVQKPDKNLILVNAQVFTRQQGQAPIELEALKGDTILGGSLKIDDTLFAPWAEAELHFSDRKRWLQDDLPSLLQAHSRARIEPLAEWFSHLQQGNKVAEFYRTLSNAQLEPNQALLQLGWGTGWDGKTFWTHLQKDPDLFEQLLRGFRMVRSAKGDTKRKPGDPFPRSRRSVVDKGQPSAPFGWVLLTMEPAG